MNILQLLLLLSVIYIAIIVAYEQYSKKKYQKIVSTYNNLVEKYNMEYQKSTEQNTESIHERGQQLLTEIEILQYQDKLLDLLQRAAMGMVSDIKFARLKDPTRAAVLDKQYKERMQLIDEYVSKVQNMQPLPENIKLWDRIRMPWEKSPRQQENILQKESKKYWML